MNVRQGLSKCVDAEAAVAEATAHWEAAPQFVLAFASSKIDPQGVAAALARRFPGAPLADCTTAGEHLGGEHATGALCVVAIWGSSMTWACRLVRGLADFDEARARHVADELFADVGAEREDLDPRRHVALLLIDGLSMAEERVCALLAEALDGVPLAGGSAGDDLGFQRCQVLTREGAFSDAAVVVLCEKGEAQVEILKHQHFVTTPRALCITKADAKRRIVYEIDGYPAVEAYAVAMGLTVEQVTNDVTFLNPLTFSCNGEIYVRSVQKLGDDGSISFYCGIEQGMVLEIGGHKDMRQELRRELHAFGQRFGRPDLLVGFNCILRALEADQAGSAAEIGCILGEHAKAVIGFDTYGEQLNGLHINQTLVAVAIREEARAA